MNALERAYKHLGYGSKSLIARSCGVTPGAVRRWFAHGVLPTTEITEIRGKRQTSYGLVIEALTNGAVTDHELRQEIYSAHEQKRAA